LACAMLAGRPRLAVEGRAWEKPPAGAGEVEAACGLPGAGPLPMRRERHAPGAATAASSRSMRGTGLSVAPHPLLRLAAVPAAGVWPAPVRAPVARPGLERHNRSQAWPTQIAAAPIGAVLWTTWGLVTVRAHRGDGIPGCPGARISGGCHGSQRGPISCEPFVRAPVCCSCAGWRPRVRQAARRTRGQLRPGRGTRPRSRNGRP
jgi:hypothetical protein